MKWIMAWLAIFASSAAAAAQPLARVPVGGGLMLGYYVSAAPPGGVTRIFIAMHGYTRDANRTFAAAAAAVAEAGLAGQTLVVAPIFQVPAARAAKCHFQGVPGPEAGDALWSCSDWSGGGRALNGALTSFAAMDRLEAALVARYPTAKIMTLAGFSAGGQFVQRYVGFANPPPGLAVRYVVADPSAFLYFDPFRPQPGNCPAYNNWKWGLGNLPVGLGRDGAAARRAYVAADVRYLEGALDRGAGKGAAYKLLERGCAAERQGAYRLDRGENFAAYDRAMLAHGAHGLTIVPGCGHAVTCVFPSPAARGALFGP